MDCLLGSNISNLGGWYRKIMVAQRLFSLLSDVVDAGKNTVATYDYSYMLQPATILS